MRNSVTAVTAVLAASVLALALVLAPVSNTYAGGKACVAKSTSPVTLSVMGVVTTPRTQMNDFGNDVGFGAGVLAGLTSNISFMGFWSQTTMNGSSIHARNAAAYVGLDVLNVNRFNFKALGGFDWDYSNHKGLDPNDPTVTVGAFSKYSVVDHGFLFASVTTPVQPDTNKSFGGDLNFRGGVGISF